MPSDKHLEVAANSTGSKVKRPNDSRIENRCHPAFEHRNGIHRHGLRGWQPNTHHPLIINYINNLKNIMEWTQQAPESLRNEWINYLKAECLKSLLLHEKRWTEVHNMKSKINKITLYHYHTCVFFPFLLCHAIPHPQS